MISGIAEAKQGNPMKKLIILTFSFISLNVFAINHNPQMHLCRQLQGEFSSETSGTDEIGLCQIGTSKIGTIDLMKYFYENVSTLSVQSFMSQQKVCSDGQVLTLTKDNGLATVYCLYSDYSIIDLKSLVDSGSFSTATLLQVLTQPLP